MKDHLIILDKSPKRIALSFKRKYVEQISPQPQAMASEH